MAKIRDTRGHRRLENGQGPGQPVNEPSNDEAGKAPASAIGAAAKALDPGLLEFEEGIRSRLGGPPEELIAWILCSPFAKARIRLAAHRYELLGDAEDVASEAILALLRTLGRPSSPVLRWDGRGGSGFWPTVFRKKVQKAVEPLLRRRNRSREYDLRLMFSLNEVRDIPTEDKNRIIVADVKNVLYFRIFDSAGKMVADTVESQCPAKAGLSNDLREQLQKLRPPHEASPSEKRQIITAVTSITGFTRSRQVKTDQLTCDRAEARAERIPSELWADVMDAISKLEPHLQFAIAAFWLKDCSYSEVERVLGVGRKTLAAWDLEAIAKLRRIFSSDA
jgi:DNA-directed RNA polymerase specialized sigma24 family protein